MSGYQSLDHLRAALDIKASDPSDVRREIRERIKLIHPDLAANGEPLGQVEQEELLKLTAALGYLDEIRDQTAVVPAEQVSSLLRVVESLIPNARQQEQEAELDLRIKDEIESIRSAFRLPKIGLATASAALTAIWLFPSTLQEHPVLGDWVGRDHDVFSIWWLFCLLATAVFWIFTGARQHKDAELARAFKLESTQNKLFKIFISSRDVDASFRRSELAEFIRDGGPGPGYRPVKLLGMNRGVDPELAESLADSILTKAESRKAVKRLPGASMDEQYELLVSPNRL
ncbi:MAG: hypothetical protein AAGI08_04620 [Bacteroidota bacterium]